MNLREEVYSELEKLGLSNIDYIDIKEIRNKDGIYLFRVKYEYKSYVLKYFTNNQYTREIKGYNILKELNIPTIKVYGFTKKALLLEDIDESSRYRLGNKDDLADIQVARNLARWYVNLHNEGEKYVDKDNNLYREIEVVTKENIEMVKKKSNSQDNKVWNLILNNLEIILRKVAELKETLVYNDFYWTNLVVSKDKAEAFMFDYNFLGIGFRYNDIRNVCSSLSEEAGKAFIEEYGKVSESEKIIDYGLSILIDLIGAYKKSEFPKWAMKSLENIHNGVLEKCIENILKMS